MYKIMEKDRIIELVIADQVLAVSVKEQPLLLWALL